MKSRYCPRCGERVQEEERFCMQCGHKLSSEAQQETTAKESKCAKGPILLMPTLQLRDDYVLQNIDMPGTGLTGKLEKMNADLEKRIEQAEAAEDAKRKCEAEERAERKRTGAKEGLFAKIKRIYFVIQGRSPRGEYLRGVVPIFCMMGLAIKGMDIALAQREATNDALLFCSLMLFLSAMIPSLGIVTRRFHDIDAHGAWSILLFIPLVNILMGLFLLFKKGTPGPNRYGDDPLA